VDRKACRKTCKRWVNGIVEQFNIQEKFEKIEEFSKQKWKKIIKEAEITNKFLKTFMKLEI